MKNWAWILLALMASPVHADTPPPGTVKIKGGTDGTIIGNSGDSLKVNATIGLPTNAAQETGGHLASMDTKLSTLNTTLGSPFQAGGSIGNSAFGISGSLPAFASTPTFNLGTLNGAATASNQATIIGNLGTLITNLGSPFQAGGSIGNSAFGISGTLPAFAATPTFNLGTLNGAATAANQASIISALGSPFQAGGSIGNASFGISGTLPAFASTPTFNLGTIGTAATAANQATEISSLSSIDTKLSSQATAANQATANASLSSIDSKLTSPVTVTPNSSAPGRSSVTLARNVYSSVNVTTSAYVQLVASLTNSVNEVEIFDSSGQTLVIAVGGAGSEVDQAYIVPGGNGRIPLAIATSSRVSIKAISATANSGEIDVNFYH